jgi:hypothetical protein
LASLTLHFAAIAKSSDSRLLQSMGEHDAELGKQQAVSIAKKWDRKASNLQKTIVFGLAVYFSHPPTNLVIDQQC